MPWFDLEAELAEEVGGLAGVLDRADLRSGALRLAWPGRTPEERRDALPPCAHCGEPIGEEELRAKGPVPTYHRACKSKAKWAARRTSRALVRRCVRGCRGRPRPGLANCDACIARSSARNAEAARLRREARPPTGAPACLWCGAELEPTRPRGRPVRFCRRPRRCYEAWAGAARA